MLSIIPTVVTVDQIVQQQQSGTGQDGGGGAVSVTSLVMPAGAKATPTEGGTGATAIITTTTTSTATNTSNSGGGQNYRDISSSGRVMTGWTTFIIIILLPFSGGLGQLIERWINDVIYLALGWEGFPPSPIRWICYYYLPSSVVVCDCVIDSYQWLHCCCCWGGKEIEREKIGEDWNRGESEREWECIARVWDSREILPKLNYID